MITYYSVDGTYLRLDFEAARDTDDADSLTDENTRWPHNGWTLYFPDGRRVKGVGPSATALIDRNGQQTTISRILDYNDSGNAAIQMSDALGRTITVEKDTSNRKDYVYQTGAGGVELKWTVTWSNVDVSRRYQGHSTDTAGTVTNPLTFLRGSLSMVSGIDLPTQLESLSYEFAYNGTSRPASCGGDTEGFGEVCFVEVPSGAEAEYEYRLDDDDASSSVNSELLFSQVELGSPIKEKTVSYTAQYDGSSTEVDEEWSYTISRGTSAIVVAPDYGVTRETYQLGTGFSEKVERFEGLSCYTSAGSLTTALAAAEADIIVERIWALNTPSGINPNALSALSANPYVDKEFRSVTGTANKTAVRDYDYDANGNLTELDEYDWGQL